MKKLFLALTAYIPLFAVAQTSAKIALEAFTITRMVAKFHVEPRDVNDAFSMDVFNQMLKQADENKVFFTADDITKFIPYSTLIDDEIKKKNTDFLNLFTAVYVQRLKQVDSMAGVACAKPFNLSLPEKFTVAEDTSFPANPAAAQQKLNKIFKLDVLEDIAGDLPDDYKTLTPAQQKKYIDSAEAVFRKKNLLYFKRRINNILQNPYGIVQYAGNMYCETIALCFDPHTEYMPKTEKENFESELGQQRFRFGFTMEEDKDGGVVISNLQPGSPAYKCGKLNKGDKFLAIQWPGKQAIDVSGSSPDELSTLISQSNHDTIYFTMRKASGAVVQVPLLKEQSQQQGEDEDDNKVKSFILKGTATIGYIYLPAFYEDWESGDNGNTGCANDVSKEIVKLKKENIDGLIIDLRYNGGGSVDEARQLAGIFIDAGPVAQEKGREPKPFTIKDIDRGTIYDGPLALLVNGYSASASELLAGTLQDYNRAVIIGAPTYGKATAQIVLPMDTTVTVENFAKKQTENYIKVTISKLYRVKGTTAQFTGVQPDIALPDILDASITKESDEEFALKPTVIDANKYFQPYPPLPVASLAAAVKQQVDTSGYFNEVKNLVAAGKQKKAPKDVSLVLASFIANNNDEDDDVSGSLKSKRYAAKNFTVQNNQYELSRLQADSYLSQLNDGFKQIISTDPYVSVAYDVLHQLKK
jgi:carboxyl-terminal processing protease